MLDNGSAAFDKITGVHVSKRTHGFDFSMVNVPANHSIKPLIIEGINNALLIIRNELNGVFDFELDEGCQGKMGLNSKKTTDSSERPISLKKKVVAFATELGNPLVILGNGVIFITMDHQKPFPLGRLMDDVVSDFDVAKDVVVIVTDIFIVIARDIDHFSVMSGLSQNLLDDRVVILWPIDSF